MTEIREIPVSGVFEAPNAAALLSEYARESSISGLPAPSPSREMYSALESSGCFHLLAAYEDETLVGFLALLVSVNPHYNAVIAVSESYFVAAAHRKSGAGLKLLRAAEAIAEERGAVGFLISAPSHGRLADVLPQRGYTETNRVFFRGLV